MNARDIYNEVHQRYSDAALSEAGKYGERVAKSFGYTQEQLAGTAQGSNLGLSCGNPLAIASVREGETVIDLGSGAGFDVFLAAKTVGPSGRVIGVDMNKDMLARADRIKRESGRENVDFVESRITDMSVLDPGVADCVISNCVINLVPEAEKHLVFEEMFRLLKPGGRLAVSDILAKGPLPDKLRSDMALYVACISGASLVSEYERYLREAGFEDILIVTTGADLNVYKQTGEHDAKPASCCQAETPGSRSGTAEEGSSKSCCTTSQDQEEPFGEFAVNIDFNQWAGAYKIYAIKV